MDRTATERELRRSCRDSDRPASREDSVAVKSTSSVDRCSAVSVIISSLAERAIGRRFASGYKLTSSWRRNKVRYGSFADISAANSKVSCRPEAAVAYHLSNWKGDAALQTASPSCGKAMTEERCRVKT